MSDRAFRIAVGCSLALHAIAAIALAGKNASTRLVPPPAQTASVRVRLAGPPTANAVKASPTPAVAAAPPRRERPEPPERPDVPEPVRTEPELVSVSEPEPEPKPAEPESLPSEPAPALAALELEHEAIATPADSGVPTEDAAADLPSTQRSTEDETNRLARYVEEVRKRIEARKRYPSMARKRAVEGRVVARVGIGADGRISSLEFDGGAPTLLRRATDDAIRAAAPYPAPPAGAVTIELPVDYALHDAS